MDEIKKWLEEKNHGLAASHSVVICVIVIVRCVCGHIIIRHVMGRHEYLIHTYKYVDTSQHQGMKRKTIAGNLWYNKIAMPSFSRMQNVGQTL